MLSTLSAYFSFFVTACLNEGDLALRTGRNGCLKISVTQVQQKS